MHFSLEDEHFVTHSTNIPGHHCTLPREGNIVEKYISEGICVQWRRKLKNLIMICPSHPLTKIYYKSARQIQMEKDKHLLYHYFMIHPFSKMRTIWETMMILNYTIFFILAPVIYNGTFYPSSFLFGYIYLPTKVIFIIDLILRFFTGYYDNKYQKVVMGRRQVFKRYLKGYFWVDLIYACPIAILIDYVNESSVPIQYVRTLIDIIRVVRISTLMEYIKRFCQQTEIWNYNVKLLNMTFGLIVFIWWLAGISLMGNSFAYDFDWSGKNVWYPMLKSCYDVIIKCFTIGVGYKPNLDSNWNLVFQIICLVFGSFLNMLIVGQIIQVYQRYVNSTDKKTKLVEQIEEYVKCKELPPRLKQKILQFIDFKLQMQSFSERELINSLSNMLKEDIITHTRKRMVKKVEVFELLPKRAVYQIVTKLKPEIYMPGDVITEIGTPGNTMFFISTGTVAVYAMNGKELIHLTEGTYFGEVALILNEQRTTTVVAVTEVELLRLSKKDFLDIVSLYPNLINKLRNSALDKLEAVAKIMERII